MFLTWSSAMHEIKRLRTAKMNAILLKKWYGWTISIEPVEYIKERILNNIKSPVKYHSMGTMITDSNNELICDIRGWGRFQYMVDGEAAQDSVGEFIASAINEKLDSDKKNTDL